MLVAELIDRVFGKGRGMGGGAVISGGQDGGISKAVTGQLVMIMCSFSLWEIKIFTT